MSKVSLPFYKAGQEFHPRLTIKDIKEYEAKVKAAVGSGAASAILQAQADVLRLVIQRDDPTVDLSAELYADEIQHYFGKVYTAAHQFDAGPLASGASAAPSSSPA
jgi:hypothetical protein